MNTPTHNPSRSFPATQCRLRISDCAAFTLVELLMAVAIFGVVMVAGLGLYTLAQREWVDTDTSVSANHAAGMAMERIVYGYGPNLGLRCARASTVALATDPGGWNLVFLTPDGATQQVSYSSARREIRYGNNTLGSDAVSLGTNVCASSAANTGSGLNLSLTVSNRQGRFAAQSTISTFVQYRN